MELSKLKSVKASIISILLSFIILLFGVKIGDRNYWFVSMSLIILAIWLFFSLFESRKPRAREIVPIAVMSAIAAIGRFAFAMLPQFKPVAAIVIITGMSFGPEAGFLTGAVSALVSNFFFGQGPWTPWQMFAFGVLGFLAGLLYKYKIIINFITLKRKKGSHISERNSAGALYLLYFGTSTPHLKSGRSIDQTVLFLTICHFSPSEEPFPFLRQTFYV